MTRHQRNCTAGTVYTYHERKKDTETSGYGTKQSRLGKDSTRNFDCCCLTLQPCKNPVITPDGWLYDKEAILEYILHQKQAIARQMKEYERQKKQLESEELAKNSEAKVKNLKRFAATEQSITSKPINPFTNGPPAKKQKTATVTSATATAAEPKPGPSRETNGEASNAKNGKELPSFWIPSLTPDAKPTLIKKPGKHVFCPMSKKQLKVKDLIDIEFVAVNDADDKRHLLNKDARYMCAVTRDTLSNSTPVAILKTSRKVITVECIEKLIKKDMIDPISGEKITEADIIKLQRGGTGFASTGVDLEAKKHRPVMMAS
ncbi:nitric oxide synthase-interacting protein-like [Ptychodera flava]|uniref:nitric oxide synthase-interacting protein-like n=1 Tax=Ptychodera flava TaxID=63121 RepID=UPI00396A9063